MATANTDFDLNHTADDTSLLHDSSDHQYDLVSFLHRFPKLSNSISESPAADVKSTLDSGLKYRVRSVTSETSMRKDCPGLESPSIRSLRPSLYFPMKESLELQKRALELEHDLDQENLNTSIGVESARPLATKAKIDFLIAIVLILLCLPFCFVFWYAIYLNHKLMDVEHWTRIQETVKLLANIYPIFFGITLGYATRKLAAWKLERGASILSLEQLMGSLSFGSTFATQLSLNGYNYLGLALLLIWALSPLAGQSSLRLLTIEQAQVISTVNVTYLRSDGRSDGIFFSEAEFAETAETVTTNALYEASLFAPITVKTSPFDIWGNIKVPDISDNNCAKPHTDETDSQECQTPYSSLLGIPIGYVPTTGNTSFAIETSYLSVVCQNKSRSEQIEEYNILDADGSGANFMSVSLESFWGPLPLKSNITMPHPCTFSLATNYLLMANDSWDVYLGIGYPPGQSTLLFQSRDMSQIEENPAFVENIPLYTHAYCALSNKYVNSSVLCIADNCTVTTAEPSTLWHPPANSNALMNEPTFYYFSRSLMVDSLIVGRDLNNGSDPISSPTQLYLGDPNFNYDLYDTGWGYADLSNVTEADLSIRLEQILNTYWQASRPTFMGFESLVHSNSQYFAEWPDSLNYTLGTNVVWQKHYSCQPIWLTLYFIATTVMLAAAVASLWLTWRVQGPEILGYCSSLVKDSAYVGIPTQSTMRATGRAKKLGKVKLRLADVAGDQDVGHIAIVDARAVDGEKVIPLSRGRRYD